MRFRVQVATTYEVDAEDAADALDAACEMFEADVAALSQGSARLKDLFGFAVEE